MLSFYTNPLHLAVSPKHIKQIHTQKSMFNPSSSSALASYSDLSMQHAGSFTSAPPEIPRGSGFIRDDDAGGGLFSLPSFAAPPPYSSSVSSYRTHMNTTSSHCFFFPFDHLQPSPPLDGNGGGTTLSFPSPPARRFHGAPVSSSSPPSSSSEFTPGNMRRVFSTGDLQMQGMDISPAPAPWPPFSGENCRQEAGEPFCQKVARYSAEERKERIERYRAKRQLRNFHKKITYVCRKTLADSRPRVQGRFARNLETTEAADIDGSSYEYCPSSDLAATSSSSSNCYEETAGSWWWGAAVGQHQQQKLGFDVDVIDDELWASLAEC